MSIASKDAQNSQRQLDSLNEGGELEWKRHQLHCADTLLRHLTLTVLLESQSLSPLSQVHSYVKPLRASVMASIREYPHIVLLVLACLIRSSAGILASANQSILYFIAMSTARRERRTERPRRSRSGTDVHAAPTNGRQRVGSPAVSYM